MTVRRATKADVAALTALWQTVFGDSPSEIAPFFAHVFSQSVGFCVGASDGIGGMVFCVPCAVACRERTLPCGYVYALGVREDLRRNGVGASLMAAVRAYAENENLAGLLTLPAEPSLFDYYEAKGFQPWSWATECSFGASAGEVDEIAPNEYLLLRQSYLDKLHMPYLLPSDGVASLYRFFAWDGGCCAVGDGLVTELCGNGKSVSAVAEMLGVSRLSVLRCGSGYPYAMALALQSDFPPDGLFSFGMQ